MFSIIYHFCRFCESKIFFYHLISNFRFAFKLGSGLEIKSDELSLLTFTWRVQTTNYIRYKFNLTYRQLQQYYEQKKDVYNYSLKHEIVFLYFSINMVRILTLQQVVYNIPGRVVIVAEVEVNEMHAVCKDRS